MEYTNNILDLDIKNAIKNTCIKIEKSYTKDNQIYSSLIIGLGKIGI